MAYNNYQKNNNQGGNYQNNNGGNFQGNRNFNGNGGNHQGNRGNYNNQGNGGNYQGNRGNYNNQGNGGNYQGNNGNYQGNKNYVSQNNFAKNQDGSYQNSGNVSLIPLDTENNEADKRAYQLRIAITEMVKDMYKYDFPGRSLTVEGQDMVREIKNQATLDCRDNVPRSEIFTKINNGLNTIRDNVEQFTTQKQEQQTEQSQSNSQNNNYRNRQRA